MSDDFNMTFNIPIDLENAVLHDQEYREIWLWGMGEIFRLILRSAPDGVADFTGRTREAFNNALNELEGLGGPVVESNYTPNPNYNEEFLAKRKSYLEIRRGAPEDVTFEFDENGFVTQFNLIIPDVVFQAQNYVGDSSHKNPQTPEPWDLVEHAEEIVRPQMKDKIVELFQRRIRSRLKTRSK